MVGEGGGGCTPGTPFPSSRRCHKDLQKPFPKLQVALAHITHPSQGT